MAPTYAEHAACWAGAGHAVTEVGAATEADADVLVLVNPNNPDGRSLPVAALLALAERQAARGGWLVVDEAFADGEPSGSLAPFAGTAGLIVLRSFGKFFGLAGLRLGVALATLDMTERLRTAIGPWAVSGPGLTVATAAFADREWSAATRTRLRAEAAGLDRLLTSADLTLVGGTGLFRLVAHRRASALYRALGEAGILVRRFERWPDWLRLGLPADADARRRLGAVLARISTL